MNKKIRSVDQLSPEDVAMLQALYSRSSKSVDNHLEQVDEKGSAQFMEKYYIGYGHDSIGQCGTTTLFIEGVSELAAKAIQDHTMYNGQQTSTRYVDMSTTGLIDPLNTPESQAILNDWMTFYEKGLIELKQRYAALYDKPVDVSNTVWNNTLHAKAFDVMRGFLPAACQTQLSFHTTLNNAKEQIERLSVHPLPEVQQLAYEINNVLYQQYTHSFKPTVKVLSTVSSYDVELGINEKGIPFDPYESEIQFSQASIDHVVPLLKKRKKYEKIDRHVMPFHRVQYQSYLDYASYRDLQRHRSGYISMPILTPYIGFNDWYINELGGEASLFIREMTQRIMALPCDDFIRQYYCALGYRVKVNIDFPLSALIYVCELRSGQTVHPTLRQWIHLLIEKIEYKYPKLQWFVDKSITSLTVKRGTQTIIRTNNETSIDVVT